MNERVSILSSPKLSSSLLFIMSDNATDAHEDAVERQYRGREKGDKAYANMPPEALMYLPSVLKTPAVPAPY